MESKTFEREVLDRLIVLETLIKNQDYATVKKTSEEADNRSRNNEKRLDQIEDNNRWLWRTVIGAILLGALAIIFGI